MVETNQTRNAGYQLTQCAHAEADGAKSRSRRLGAAVFAAGLWGAPIRIDHVLRDQHIPSVGKT